jgi:type IV pilus assembly protein PilB
VIEPRQNGRRKLGEILLQEGFVDKDQLQSALTHQVRWGGRLGRSLLALRFLREEQLLTVLGRQLGIPVVRIGNRHVARDVLARVPAKMMLARNVLPLEFVRERRPPKLLVAFSSPEDLHLRDEVAFAAGLGIQAALAGEDDLKCAIANHLHTSTSGRTPRSDGIELSDDPCGPMQLVDGREIIH